jgi:predicted peroxiredoxin
MVEHQPISGLEVSQPDRLLVVLTASLADGGRLAAIAFGVALAALSNGTDVYVFLSLESAVLGAPSGADGIRPRGFSEPLASYIQHFVELGGQLEVCSSCYEEYCRGLPKDESGRPALRAGTQIRSLGVVAERAQQMPVISF